MIKLRSVRARLIVLNVAVLAAVLVLLGAALRFTLQQSMIVGVDQRLLRITGPMKQDFESSPLPQPGDFGGPGGPDGGPDYDPGGGQGEGSGQSGGADQRPRPNPRPRRPPPGDYPPRLFSVDGRSMGGGPRPPGQPYDPALLARSASGRDGYSSVDFRGTLIRVYSAPIVHNGKVDAVIQAGQPLADVTHGVAQLTKTLLLISPLALLIAGLSGSLLASHAMRPVRQLVRTTASIDAGGLAGRIPVEGADEFAELSSTINGMFARLESSFAQQDEAIKQLRRFTADASHELRTPLTVIKANTSLALSGPSDVEMLRLALMEADWAADRMNAIVQDLLLLARSDSGPLEMAYETVALEKIIAEAVRLSAKPGCAPIETLPLPPSVTLHADRLAIERLLGNLLRNAQAHTPTDGRVTVDAQTTAGAVRITITDTGDGIAPQHLPHIFERFYRVDSARTRESGGTGLGLAICRTIAEAHGGTVEIASVVGKGTQAIVTLPIVVG